MSEGKFIVKQSKIDLENKIVVITGSNRGIGLEIAKTFVAHNAKVIACMRNINENTLSEISSKYSSDSVKGVNLDLSNENSIKAAIKQIGLLSSNKIDVLVNNAGTSSGGMFQMASIAEMRRVFEINFFGQITFTQGLSRLMTRQKSGSIINVTSSASDIPDPGTLIYGSSKAALARATRSMATELGAFGVRVNAISPGVTRTDMFNEMSELARNRLIGISAFQRPAEPQDVANLALFLASDLSAFVTGQILRIDGGMI